MVRKATYADAHAIKELVRKAWARTDYGHLPISDKMLARTVHEYLTHQRSRVWVSEDDKGLTGILAASYGQLEISEALASTDSVFYCESGDGHRLIGKYVRWAKKNEVAVIGMCVSSGSNRADRLIESTGFKRAGGNFYWGNDE